MGVETPPRATVENVGGASRLVGGVVVIVNTPPGWRVCTATAVVGWYCGPAAGSSHGENKVAGWTVVASRQKS